MEHALDPIVLAFALLGAAFFGAGIVAGLLRHDKSRERRDLEDYCDAMEHKCRVLGRHNR